ncbi:Lysozyme-like protein [Glarea lozoyensis ATCC 20868]|uniref:Lysozyme-like protein n=1 Tax=Glarea lozoyensis (strain ATCC 20868 / MF5171) TaxID=1116229 RepID=S3D2D9_GLAL2|nr:Lysozyme-like protein [Glarea lozoyensis ATCC 20868]EPE31289.1 Lysozyme-like protein [Glarea lozoyensis ATCC 20868]
MVHLSPASLAALLLFSSPIALAAPGNTACQINSKQDGLCMATASCKSSGGTSQAGHCPGGTDNQCCTYGSCTVSSISGLCQTTSTCGSGYTSTAGHCPGPAGIQCCTKKSTSPAPGPAPAPAPAPGGCSNGAPKVNTATLKLIEGFEGWSATAYKDPDGNPTIGYGHLCSSASCKEIKYSIPLSRAEGDSLIQDDLAVARKCIAKQIKDSIKLNANQFGALVSWAFNVGCGNSGDSTLIRRLNAGEAPNTVAGQELPKWNRGKNGVLPGLTRRRNAENFT